MLSFRSPFSVFRMLRPRLQVLLVLALLAMAPGCEVQGRIAEYPTKPPDLRGEVIRYLPASSHLAVVDAGGQPVLLTVSRRTKVFRRIGELVTVSRRQDLRSGDQIEVWLAEPPRGQLSVSSSPSLPIGRLIVVDIEEIGPAESPMPPAIPEGGLTAY